MSPIIVAIFSHIFLKERLKWVQWLGVIISITGSFIITFMDLTSNFSLIGSLLALFGALFLAVYLVGGRKLRIKYGLIPYVFLVYLTATLSLLIMNLLYQGSVLIVSVYDFINIILLALMSTIFGHTLYNFALGNISASVISIILLGEPVISTLLAIVILSEFPTIELLIGGILILARIFITIKKLGKMEIRK
jgi:drug/metabolite transporter (DMT)-like permease